MNDSIKIIKPWEEYELLDCGEGEKIERWGKYLLIRPEPQAIWNKTDSKIWIDFDAKYNKFSSNGQWEFRKPIPSRWDINYKRYKFIVKPTNFKHTGIFPEQSINWEVRSNIKFTQ